MRNKLTILAFLLTLSIASLAQGESELTQDVKISIYPNPAVEFIFVQFEGESSEVEFELNSMIGNKLQIKPEEVGHNKYKIPVKDLATGYYFLVVKDEDKRFRKAYKFLKH
ncbi:T9SS type A sorting domain-containing protein [Ekhidna sp.]|uniref:T9SS type A sorting domain-containing protein n=1 Tax=Ekhidna sp. TaxID=2608089 RepID=UPI003CCBE467